MLDWLFPPVCPACLKPVLPKGGTLHPGCAERLKKLSEPLCKKCGKPIESMEEEVCSDCSDTERIWELGRSVYPYQGPAGQAVRKIKESGTRELVAFFANEMAETAEQQGVLSYLPETVWIVPVPLHRKKLRERGFNQAKLLADVVGEKTGLPVKELLVKKKRTKDQKNLPREQRRKNVRDAYCLNGQERDNGIPEAVLLVDDVMTTGSTLTACARVLKENGVRIVRFLTVCSGE